MSVQSQWDVVKTTFDTSSKLRSLIGLASQPDVQPQAVLAAENLGFGLMVSATRINDAVTALGGNNSVRVESLQAEIGIRCRELQVAMRQSTGLLQFFLVITACKPCFLETELGDLAFYMMEQTKVLARFPVSSSQLARLIHAFSAQSETIVPVEDMHTMAVAFSSAGPDRGLYDRMEPELLAQILVRTFESLADESVPEMTLIGRTHAVWIATFFSWLLPDHTHVRSGKVTIMGHEKAKLTIDIAPERDAVWRLEIYKTEEDVTKHIFESREDEIQDLHRLPLKLAKQYFDDHYCYHIKDARIRSRAIFLMGELARNLKVLFSEHGQLFLRKGCCGDLRKKCLTATVINIMSDSGLSEHPNSMCAYGWDNAHQSSSDLPKVALEQLRKDLDNVSRTLRKEESPAAAWLRLLKTCFEWVKERTGIACGQLIVDPAMYLALDAVLTSTVVMSKGTRYFSPSMTGLDWEGTGDVVGQLLWCDGLEIRQFRELAFANLLPGLPSSSSQYLAATYGGYTVGMDVLWNISALQRSALGIRYGPGYIEKDGTPVSCVREAVFSTFMWVGAEHPEEAVLFQDGMYRPLRPQSMSMAFETRTTIQGDHLVLKHYATPIRPAQFNSGLEAKTPSGKASWITAIDVIALATHVSRGHELTTIQEQQLAERLHDLDLHLQWLSGIGINGIKLGAKVLLRTSGVEKNRFFAASWGHDKSPLSEQCFRVLVRHNAPLLPCIKVAEDSGQPWVIIT